MRILKAPIRFRPGLAGLAAVLLALSCPPGAFGQKATEQFIPIGQSPGLSEQYTYRGSLEAVDAASRTVTVEGRSVQVTDATRIWLDRSASRQSNLAAGFDALQPGREVEIHYVDIEQRERAAWIKIAPAGGS